jgi:phosphatidylinositol alpha-1,6-mannosyltransferase
MDKKAKKVLILTADFPLWDGGVSVFGEKLAKHLHLNGHFVDVLTPKQLKNDPEYDKSVPFTVKRLKNIKDRYLKYFYSYFALFLNRKAYDAIIVTTWFPYANAALALFPKTPIYLFAHGNDFLEKRWQKPFWNKRMTEAFEKAHHVIAVSTETKKALLHLYPHIEAKVSMIHPAVDPEDFIFNPENSKRHLVTIGRLVERKGQDRVIEALPRVLQEFPDVHYTIAGRGGYENKLKQMVEEKNLSQHVSFAGFINDDQKKQLYRDSYLYIMPSRTIMEKGDIEGFGITFLEANAAGKPVIGSFAGGVVEAVRDRETGLLANQDSVDDIAEKILELLRNPDYAKQLGSNGRKYVETEANWENSVRKLCDLFNS